MYISRLPSGFLEDKLVQAHAWVAYQISSTRRFWTHWELQRACIPNTTAGMAEMGALTPHNSARLLCLTSFQILARHIAFKELAPENWTDIDVWTRPGDVGSIAIPVVWHY